MAEETSDPFMMALIATPPHVCDETCEQGEESITRTFVGPDLRVVHVHGPRDQVEAMRSYVDLTSPDPLVKSSDVYLPVKPGRAVREAIQARAARENPGARVIVDCWGGVLVIPAGFGDQSSASPLRA